MNQTFFFSTNAPLGTMLISFVGWLAGFDGKFAAVHIGQSLSYHYVSLLNIYDIVIL